MTASEDSKPTDVPVFSCLVYVRRGDDGSVQARVANLSGIQDTAATERGALGKVVSAFKQRVAELVRSASPIPWIDPPLPAEADEQQRFIAVHL